MKPLLMDDFLCRFDPVERIAGFSKAMESLESSLLTFEKGSHGVVVTIAVSRALFAQSG